MNATDEEVSRPNARRRPGAARRQDEVARGQPARSRESIAQPLARAVRRRDVDRADGRQSAQRKRVAATRELLRIGENELLASARRDRKHARGELVPRSLLEERRILLAMEK